MGTFKVDLHHRGNRHGRCRLHHKVLVLLIARLSADTGDAVMNRLDKRAARRIFSDPKIYLGVLAYFGKSSSSTSCYLLKLTHC
jgi:hypothetical protein